MSAPHPDPLPTAELPDVPKAVATISVASDAAITGSEVISTTVTDAHSISQTRYALGGEIGSGGMGIIYRATDTTLKREVALKVLQTRYALNSGAARRFTDEARIAAQLQHPAIPPIHDLGTLPDGRPFLAMKLIKGETLETLLSDRRSPGEDRGRFVAIFEQVCQAIAYAHSHRVIHRDLKPANVMVGSFAEVQVMDWGLAKVIKEAGSITQEEDPDATLGVTEIHSLRDSDGTKTQAGSVLGTPAFMPPEQAVGAIEQIDAQSDVFGLGAILAVILTNQPPFVGTTRESTRVLAAQGKLEDCLARLDESGADPELTALCKRCLAPLKTERPRDADEVAKAVAELRAAADERARQAELDRVRAEGERIKAKAEAREERIRREGEQATAKAEAREQRKRRRVQLALAAAVVLLLAAIGSFMWWEDRQEIARRERLGKNAEAVTALLDQTEAALKVDDPDRAEFALAQAEKRFGDGGAGDSKERLELLRVDLTIMQELDRIDTFRWTPEEWKSPEEGTTASKLLLAFRQYGIIPGTTSLEQAARMISHSAIRDRLVGALDQLLSMMHSIPVVAILAEVDPDSFRNELREAILSNKATRLRELAQTDKALSQPMWFVVICNEKSIPMARRRLLMERALVNHPGDQTLLMSLAGLYPINQREGAEERMRWYQAVVAVHPRNIQAWNLLGIALRDKGDMDGAIASFKEVLRIDPSYVLAHSNLGWALAGMGDLDGGIDRFKEVIRHNPSFLLAHQNLGWALIGKGDWDEAITASKAALRIEPKYALPMLKNLKLSGMERYAYAHIHLGYALQEKGDLDGALAAYKDALQLDKTNAFVNKNMALIDRTKSLLPRLNEVASGRSEPRTPVETCDFARLCAYKLKKYALASRLYTKAFTERTKLADVLDNGNRYHAARCAVLAGCGKGADAPADGEARAALRQQALEWLRDDLIRQTKQVQVVSDRRSVASSMIYWLNHNDFAGVRPGPDRIEQSAKEQAEWNGLWADVRALLAEVQKMPPPPRPIAPPPREVKH